MSVEASFIDSLLATSGGSDGPGDAVSDGDSGADADAGDSGSETGKQPASLEVGSNGATGDQPAAGAKSGAEDVKQPAVQPAPADTKPANDDPVTQIGRLNGALREVRGENKDLKQQLSQYSAQLAAMQEQIKALAQPAAKPAEEEPEPDFLSDPKVYVDKTAAKTVAALKKLEEAQAEQAKREAEGKEQAKKQEEVQQQWTEVLSQEAAFSEATPDYQQALGYIRNLRVQAFTAEFEATNDRAPTQAEIGKALTAQEIQGALLLQQKGKNPAQWYYDYAKRLGYKAPEPATELEAEPAAAAKPVAKPAPVKPDKEAVKSMGSGGSSGATSDPEETNRDPMASLLAGVHGEMTAKRKARRA